MNSDLSTILFLDIETVACVPSYNNLNERLKVQWARKASFFKRDQDLTDEDLFNLRAGIYSEFGKIIAIGVGKFYEPETGTLGIKTRCLSNHDEKALLTDFKNLLEKSEQSNLKLCAHNGKEFDFPYLCRRMLVNTVPLPEVLNHSGKKPWEVPYLDTMEMWKFGDHKHYTSLDLLAAIFDIPTSKTEMDGSMVNQVYYEEKNLSKIATYCVGDVVALAQLYLKLKGMSLVDQRYIVEG
jgi:predicted PolB exonuclease-like 3'-5' exonuclease